MEQAAQSSEERESRPQQWQQWNRFSPCSNTPTVGTEMLLFGVSELNLLNLYCIPALQQRLAHSKTVLFCQLYAGWYVHSTMSSAHYAVLQFTHRHTQYACLPRVLSCRD